MRRDFWLAVIIGFATCFLAGVVIDLVWYRLNFSAHLAIQFPAGIAAMFLAAWWFDRRRARRMRRCDVAGCQRPARVSIEPWVTVCPEHMTSEDVGRLLDRSD